jgi:cytoskeletal protein CcmA (bactofilin family)
MPKERSMWTPQPARATLQPLPQPVTPALPIEDRRVVVWVGKSVVFTGALISSEDMMIDGRVEGTIEVREHRLTIGPNAQIHADVVAHSVTIHGTVTGNIHASDQVDIRSTGRIDGSLVTPRIAVADGAIVHGRIDTLTQPGDAAKRPVPVV